MHYHSSLDVGVIVSRPSPVHPPVITPRSTVCPHCDAGVCASLDYAASVAWGEQVERECACEECGGSGYRPGLECERGCQSSAADCEGETRWHELDGEPVCDDCLRDALVDAVRAGYSPAMTEDQIDRAVDDARARYDAELGAPRVARAAARSGWSR
jgi:hypothetical protein